MRPKRASKQVEDISFFLPSHLGTGRSKHLHDIFGENWFLFEVREVEKVPRGEVKMEIPVTEENNCVIFMMY